MIRLSGEVHAYNVNKIESESKARGVFLPTSSSCDDVVGRNPKNEYLGKN